MQPLYKNVAILNTVVLTVKLVNYYCTDQFFDCMGIKNFTKFVADRVKCPKVKLTRFEYVAVDGNNICHFLYHEGACNWRLKGQDRCDWLLGGEYPYFQSKVKEFFSEIREAGVKPIVVFDGTLDRNKLNTIIQRREEKNYEMLKIQEKNHEMLKIQEKNQERKVLSHVAPVLMIRTFIDVINEMGIELRFSASDCDREVAAVANSHNCPVLANDSDYFMFELKHGYIPLKTFVSVSEECPIYHTDLFDSCFKLEPRFRLLIPAIHGNDFLENVLHLPERDPYDFMHTLKIAGNYSSCEDYLAKEGTELVRKNFQAAVKQYCEPKLLPDSEFKAEIACEGLPEWIYEKYKTGCFPPSLLSMKKNKLCVQGIVVEDITRESAWICSTDIRCNIYSFMGLSDDLTEYVRKEASSSVIQQNLILTNSFFVINDVLNMTDSERENFVLDILIRKFCLLSKESEERFAQLEGKWKLPIAATIYWYHSSGVNKDVLKSILLCFLCCSGVIDPPPCKLNELRKNLSHLQAFAQWQCVYTDAMLLNYVVKEIFLSTSPALLFSGRSAMFFAHWNSSSKFFNGVPQLHQFLELIVCCKKKQVVL